MRLRRCRGKTALTTYWTIPYLIALSAHGAEQGPYEPLGLPARDHGGSGWASGSNLRLLRTYLERGWLRYA